MPKRVIDLRDQQPLLDIVSYGRGSQPLTPHQRLQIALTVRRVPEVMVKVSGGARTLAGVEKHVSYVGREGQLGLETDMGNLVGGNRFARHLIEDWDLDLEALKRQSERSVRGRKPAKLVHNLIFSMPPGTSAQKMLRAVERLARNEWKLKHRYAMVLHTDTPHPHVHVVVKAMSEQGTRLNIKKATLRSWRSHFAANLRELGIAANATECAVRGENRTHKSDGFFRTEQRRGLAGAEQEHKIITEMKAGGVQEQAGGRTIRRTRAEVLEGWRAVGANLRARGEYGLADQIRIFTASIRAPRTEKGQRLLNRSQLQDADTRPTALGRDPPQQNESLEQRL